MGELPEKIYLQIGDHNYDDLQGSDVTWSQDKINSNDLEYNIAFPNPCTVEQWEEITGETFPDEGIVHVLVYKRNETGQEWESYVYGYARKYWAKIYIVQTAKPAPEDKA